MGFFRESLLAAAMLAGCITSAMAGTAVPDTQTDRPPHDGCASGLGEWDAEQLRALQATGIYDNPDESRETGTYLVYLAFHIVRTGSGSGGIGQSRLDQAMLDLAAAFYGTGICFTVAHQDTIDNSNYFIIDNDTERATLKGINNQPDMIDCYFVDYDGGFCGVSSYTWSPEQGITYANGCVGLPGDRSTFPHEIGHYFNLLHTHETAYGVECATGSNCATAGDLVCDTPADPGLSDANVGTNCVYTGGLLSICDSQVLPYSPNTANHMSSSRKTCRTQFSPGQRSRMLTTLTNLRWGEVGFNSPDFDFTTPAGWTNALVPRGTTGASFASCAVTTTLPGDSSSTWLNQAIRQANDSSHDPGVYGRIFLDNDYFWWYSYGGGTFSGTRYYNNFGPITVRGGRHALHSVVDYYDDVCESDESDNIHRFQWVWSPLVIQDGQRLQRSAPPQRMTPTYAFPNCDGLQFTGSSWWSVLAIQSVGSGADYDLRLHQDYTGSTAGFQAMLAASEYSNGAPDWVMVNHNMAGPGGTYQAGINNYGDDSADVRVNKVESRSLWKGDGTRIVGTIAGNQILDIFEVYFDPDEISQSWTVTLRSPDAVDLDLYLYPAGESWLGRSDYVKSGQASGSPNETLTLVANSDLPVAGWYAFVVAKDGLPALTAVADYEVRFTNNSPELGINPPTVMQVAVVQDQAPWGGTEWTDQLTAQAIAYTVIPTANLASTPLDSYGAVIIPSPESDTSHDNIMASITRLDDYNRRGGVLVQGTATTSPTTGFTAAGGVQATWDPCDMAHTWYAGIVDGAGLDTGGGSAVHHILTAPDSSWTMVAASDCAANAACMLINESAGMLVYGAPMEHSVQFFDLSLGESIENIVRWAAKRARQTIRRTASSGNQPTTASLVYSKGPLSIVTYTNTGTSPWLTINPASAHIPLLDTSDPVTFTFDSWGMPAGIHRADVTVTHTLYNTPETVYTYLDIPSGTPARPLDLRIAPVDFSPGHATVNVNWTPVTTDVNGLPLAVEYYNLYYSQDPYLGTANVLDLDTVSVDLLFANIGWLDMAFIRVTAVDTNGLLVADSQPDLPLPHAVAGDPRLLQPAVPGARTH